jgi:hypothetical protein
MGVENLKVLHTLGGIAARAGVLWGWNSGELVDRSLGARSGGNLNGFRNQASGGLSKRGQQGHFCVHNCYSQLHGREWARERANLSVVLSVIYRC